MAKARTKVLTAAETAATAKRTMRAEKLCAASFAPVIPTGSAGPSFVRAAKRREFRASPAFDHGSAAAAAMRHRAARKGKPRVARKSFQKKPYDALDHVHPRHKREWLRQHAA